MATDDWNEPLLGDSQDYAETPGRQVRTSHTDSSASGDYSLLADAEGVSESLEVVLPVYTATLACDHAGPDSRQTRLIKGKSGEAVRIIRKISEHEYFVEVTKTSSVGVATHICDVSPELQPNNPYTKLVKKYEELDGDWSGRLDQYINQEQAYVNRTPNETTLRDKLMKATSRRSNDLALHEFVARMGSNLPEPAQEQMCLTMFFFVLHQKKLIQSQSTLTESEREWIAIDTILFGTTLLVNLRHEQLHFSRIMKSNSFLALLELLNNFALTCLQSTFGQKLCKDVRLLPRLSRSLPDDQYCVEETAVELLANQCKASCIHLLFALIIVDSSLSVSQGEGPVTWGFVAEGLRWYDTETCEIVFMQALARDYELGYFERFAESPCPVHAILERLFIPCADDDSDEESEAEVMSPAHTRSVWSLIEINKMNSEKVGPIARFVLRCLGQSLYRKATQVLAAASHHLWADALLQVADCFAKDLTLDAACSKFHKVLDLVNRQEHHQRMDALKTIRLLLLNVAMRDHGGSLQNVLEFVVNQLLTPTLRGVPHLWWAYRQLALAILEEGLPKPNESTPMICGLLVPLCDIILCDDDFKQAVSAQLPVTIRHLQTILSGSAKETARLIADSKALQQCEFVSSTPLQAVPCIPDGLPMRTIHSPVEAVSEAVAVLQIFAKANLHISMGSSAIIFLQSFCEWLESQWRQRSHVDGLDALKCLADFIEGHVAVHAERVDLLLPSALVVSSLLVALDLVAPHPHVLMASPQLVHVLRVCFLVWREYMEQGKLPKSLLCGYSRLNGEFSGLMQKLNDKRYSRLDWLCCKDLVMELNCLLQAMCCSPVGELESFETLAGEYEKCAVVLDWLATKDVPDASQQLQSLRQAWASSSTRYCDLKSLLANVQQSYIDELCQPVSSSASIPVHQYIFQTVAPCKLCDFYAKLAPPSSLIESTWSQRVTNIVQFVFKQIKSLLDFWCPYSKLRKVIAGLQGTSEASLSLLYNEADILAKSGAHEKDMEGIQRLKRLLLLISVRKDGGVVGLIKALQDRVAPTDPDLQELQKHSLPTAHIGDETRLGDFDNKSAGVYNIIVDLQLWHWSFFRLLAKRDCRKFFAFFKQIFHNREEFQDRLTIANTRLEGDPSRSAVLTNLLNVQSVMADFYLAEPTVRDIVSRLTSAKYTEAGDFENAMENLDMIKELLDSVMESSFDRAKRHLDGLTKGKQIMARIDLDDGQRVVCSCRFIPPKIEDYVREASHQLVNGEGSSANGNDTLQECPDSGEQRTLHQEDIDELLPCLPYFYHQTAKDESGATKPPSDLPAYHLWRKVHQLCKLRQQVADLLDDGNSSFLRSSLRDSFPFTEQDMKALESAAQEHWRRWKATLAAVRRSYPCLSMFSNKVVGKILECMESLLGLCKTDGVMPLADAMKEAFIVVSYLYSLHGLLSIPQSLTPSSLCKMVSRLERDSDPEATLQAALKAVLDIPVAPQPCDTEEGEHSIGQVLSTVEAGQSPQQALMSIVCLYFAQGSDICRSQFLFCSDVTTSDDVESFSRRMRQYVSKRFVICGVDKLPVQVQAKVLSLQEDLAGEGQTPQVIYLFYDKTCWSAWPKREMFQQQVLRPMSYGDLQHHLNTIAGWSSNQLNITVVTGKAGAGKSRYISDLCAEEPGRVPHAISITSSTSLANVCQELSAVTCAGCVERRSHSFVFRVGYNCNLAVANQLFFELVWCGCIMPSVVGDVFAVVPHAERQPKWFVEIPELRNETRENMTQLQLAEGKLPFLLAASTSFEVTTDTYPLQLDEQKYTAAAVLKAYFSGDLGLPHHRGPCQYPMVFSYSRCENDDVCRKALEEFFQRLRGGHGNRCLELLALEYLYRKWSSLEKDGTFRLHVCNYRNLAELVFENILVEATQLCHVKDVCNYHESKLRYVLFDGSVRFLAKPEKLRNLSMLRSRSTDETPDIPLCRAEDYEWFGDNKAVKLLAWTFGMTAAQIEELLSQQEFVLTEDFAFKLVMIHERMKFRRPLILEGETGAGKTFLLDTYTRLLNYQAANAPWLEDATRLFNRFNRWLLNLVLDTLWEHMHIGLRSWFSGPHHSGDDYPANRKNKEDAEVEHLLGRDEYLVDGLLRVWQTLLSGMPKVGKTVAIARLQKEVKRLVRKLRLLEPISIDLRVLLEKDTSSLTDEESCELIRMWLGTKERSLFRKLLVHPGLKKANILQYLRKVSELAMEIGKHTIVVFFDEVNTSSCIDVFKDLIVDRSMEGLDSEALEKMFFVAAINPYREAEEQWNTNHFPVMPSDSAQNLEAWQAELGQQYLVNRLPATLEYYKWIYRSLAHPKELKEYTSAKIKFIQNSPLLQWKDSTIQFDQSALQLLSSSLHHAYEYCRERVCDSFTSQRDVQRVFKLIPYFWKVEKYKLMRESHEEVVNTNEILRCCILQSIAMVFYLRLPAEQITKYPGVCRQDFDDQVSDKVAEELHLESSRSVSPAAELARCVDEFVSADHFDIPKNIALTAALKENIFCTVACIQQGIPLAIIGEPGSSKTLSYHIVCKNLRGEHSNREFCRQFVAVDSFFCQCSPDTTTEQIQAVFRGALGRQSYHQGAEKKREETERLQAETGTSPFASLDVLQEHLDAGYQQRPETSQAEPWPCHTHTTVFIDEAGLPSMKHNRMVMKVLHQYLDDPRVAFVALSNHWFDAANTNRMLTVFRSHASTEDLISLARGCLGLPCLSRSRRGSMDLFIEGICAGYKRVREHFPNWFHQRDLISLFKCLQRHKLVHKSAELSISPSDLLTAFEENFSGLSDKEFDFAVNKFFEEVRKSFPAFQHDQQALRPIRKSIDVLLSLKHQLSEHLKCGYFRNTSSLAPRYQLLVDESGCNSGVVDLLFHVGVFDSNPGQTRVFQLSSVSADNLELQCVNMLAQIRQCLDKAVTVVILNSPKLHGYMYELLNQSYRTVMVGNKECAYSSIAMKDSTFPCQVHADFRCVVIVSRELAKRERTPFLSRFAKFSVIPRHAREYINAVIHPSLSLEPHIEKVQAFAEHVHESHFYGCGYGGVFAANLDCVALRQIVRRAEGQFSRSPHSRVSETTMDAVSCLFRLMPLDNFMSVHECLEPDQIYWELYKNAHGRFTLAGLLQRAVENVQGSKGISKVVATTNSSCASILSLLDEEQRHLCIGKALSQQVAVKSCNDGQTEVERSLSEFLHSAQHKCCILLLDSSEIFSGAQSVSVVKLLVDEQCSLWTSSCGQMQKTIVVLVYSSLRMSGKSLTSSAFLNSWQSCFVSVARHERLCPMTVVDMLEVSRLGPFSSIAESVVPNFVSKVLTWMMQNRGLLIEEVVVDSQLAKQFCIENFPAEIQLLFGSSSLAAKKHSAMEYVFEAVPRLLPWVAEHLVQWAVKNTGKLVHKAQESVRAGVRKAMLVDCLLSEQCEKLRHLLKSILQVILSGPNPAIMPSSEIKIKKENKDNMIMLVSEQSCRHAPGSQDSSSFVTPFFFHARYYIGFVGQGRHCRSVQSMHTLLKEDIHVGPLLRDEAFLQCYVKDFVMTGCDWVEPSNALDIAWTFLKMFCQKQYPGLSIVSFLHANWEEVKPKVLAVLYGGGFLLEHTNFTCDSLEGIVSEADDILEFIARTAIEQLWDCLVRILAQLREGQDSSACTKSFSRWQTSFDHIFSHWPLIRSRAGHDNTDDVTSDLRECLDNVEMKGSTKICKYLLTTTFFILRSFASIQKEVLRFLKEFAEPYMETGPQAAAKLSNKYQLRALLERAMDISYKYGSTTERLQLKLYCIQHWIVLLQASCDAERLEETMYFGQILKCFCHVQAADDGVLEVRQHCPEDLAVCILMDIEEMLLTKLIKDSATSAAESSHVKFYRTLQSSIQAGINRFLHEENKVVDIPLATVGYFPSLFKPSDFPVGMQTSTPAEQIPADPRTFLSSSLLQSLYRAATVWRRRLDSELVNLVSDATPQSFVDVRLVSLADTCHNSLCRVVIQNAHIKVAIEKAACCVRDFVIQCVDMENRGHLPEFTLRDTIDGLLHQHSSVSYWFDYLIWCVIQCTSPRCVERYLGSCGSSWAQHVTTICGKLWPMDAHTTVNRLERQFPSDARHSFILDCFQQLDAVTSTGGLLSGGVAARLADWYNEQCMQLSPPDTKLMEMSVFWKMSEDMLTISDSGNFHALPQNMTRSSLLKPSLRRLVQHYEQQPATAFSALLHSTLDEDLAVRGILLQTMAAVLGMADESSHLLTCVCYPNELVGSYLFGATSNRDNMLGSDGSLSVDDFFQFNHLGLPGCCIEHCKSPSCLSLVGYVLNAIHTYAALCWNAVLFPELQQYFKMFSQPASPTSLSDDDAAVAQRLAIEHCISKVRHFYRMLPKADLNVISFSSRYLVETSLKCSVLGSHVADARLKARYRSHEERNTAELFFKSDVIRKALVIHGRNLNCFLQHDVSETFADMYRLQLPSGFLTCHEYSNIVWSSAVIGHAILAEVLAFWPVYELVQQMEKLVKYYFDLKECLRKYKNLTYAEVVGRRLTLRMALAGCGGQLSHDLQSNFDGLKTQVVSTVSVLRQMYGNATPPWICELSETALSLDMALVALVDFGGSAHQLPLLPTLITELLSWQNRLLTLCEQELSGPTVGSGLKSCLESCVYLQPVHISVLRKENVMLQFGRKDLQQLLALYCRKEFNQCWRVNADMDRMQESFVLQYVSRARRVEWSMEDKVLLFSGSGEGSLESHVCWVLGNEVQLESRQKHCVSRGLGRTDFDGVQNLRELLEQTMKGLVQLIVEQDWAKLCLEDLIGKVPDIDASLVSVGSFLSEIPACSLLPLYRLIEQYLEANKNSPMSVSPMLSKDLSAECQQDLSERLTRNFESSPEGVEGLERLVVLLLEHQQEVEQDPSRELCRLASDLGEHHRSEVEKFVARLPGSLLGHHYKSLVTSIVLHMQQCRAAMLSAAGVQPRRDPCQFSQDQTTIEDLVTVLVQVEQRKPKLPDYDVTLMKQRMETILAVLEEAIVKARGGEREIIHYDIGDEEGLRPEDGDPELEMFLEEGAEQLKLEVTVRHKKPP